MHVAAALDRPAVVIAGGREPVQWNAYPKQQYVHTVGMLPCVSTQGEVGAACWRSRVRAVGDGNPLDAELCQRPVGDVAECLVKMGAKIEGIGSSTLTVQGVDELAGAVHEVLPDRIETGTYAMAVAATGGDVLLDKARPDLLHAALDVLTQAGVEVTETNRGLRVARDGARLEPVAVETQPFPGFPTDLQAQLMALMALAKGSTRIRETIFENRFMHVQELARLGADIALEGDTAIVTGVEKLRGAQVMATDLRASVSLVIAGLVAEGETTVNRVYHLDRGFERIEQKLGNCGAQIERLTN